MQVDTRYQPPCSLQTYFSSLQKVVWLGKNQQPDMPWWWSLLASTAVFNTGLNLLCTSFLYPLLLLSNASYVGGEEYLFALEMLLLFSWSHSHFTSHIILTRSFYLSLILSVLLFNWLARLLPACAVCLALSTSLCSGF